MPDGVDALLRSVHLERAEFGLCIPDVKANGPVDDSQDGHDEEADCSDNFWVFDLHDSFSLGKGISGLPDELPMPPPVAALKE